MNDIFFICEKFDMTCMTLQSWYKVQRQNWQNNRLKMCVRGYSICNSRSTQSRAFGKILVTDSDTWTISISHLEFVNDSLILTACNQFSLNISREHQQYTETRIRTSSKVSKLSTDVPLCALETF